MRKKYCIFWLISACIVALDQVTKYLVTRCIVADEGFNLLPGLVNVVHVRNPGAAFGIMSESGGYFRWYFLVAVSFAALAIVLFLAFRSKALDYHIIIAYALFFSGTAGNLVDRLRFGEVIDFIDVYVGKYHWPAFNVADAALCAGVGLLLLKSFREVSGRSEK